MEEAKCFSSDLHYSLNQDQNPYDEALCIISPGALLSLLHFQVRGQRTTKAKKYNNLERVKRHRLGYQANINSYQSFDKKMKEKRASEGPITKADSRLTCHVFTARSVPLEKLEYSMSSSPQ